MCDFPLKWPLRPLEHVINGHIVASQQNKSLLPCHFLVLVTEHLVLAVQEYFQAIVVRVYILFIILTIIIAHAVILEKKKDLI